MPSSRTISANALDFFVVEQGQGPLVLLCPGWPELSYSWRHQIPAIAEPWFLAFNASIEIHPVMTLDDLAKAGGAIENAVKKFA